MLKEQSILTSVYRIASYRIGHPVHMSYFAAKIWESAKPILEEQYELERARLEEERNREQAKNDDYTSLYWNEDGTNKSENEYEVVEGDNNRCFSGKQ